MATKGSRARSEPETTAPWVVLDLEGWITRASDSFLTLLGRDRDQVEGRSFTEIVHPDDVALAFATGRAAAKGDQTTHVEQRYMRGDGRPVWVLVTVRAARDEQGRPYELCVEVRDVTAARRVAEAAREGRDEYRRLVEETRDGVWVLGPDGTTASVSQAVTELLGYSEDELRGRHPHEFTDEEGAEILRAGIQRRRRGETETYDVKWITRDGRVVWTLLSAAPLLDDDGRFQGSLGLVTDITQRREAEGQRQRLAAIVESTSDAVFGLDHKARIRDANAAAVELTGVRREEILGVALSDVLEPLASLPPDEILRQVLAGEDVPPLDSPVRRPDGRTVEVSASFGPIRDARGAIVGVSVVARDVSAERDAARRLARLARRQEAVAGLGQRALGKTSIEALEHDAVALVCDVLATPIVTVFEPTADGERLRLRAVHGVEARLRDVEIPASAGPPLASLQRGEVIVQPDWQTQTRFERPQVGVETGIRSTVAVPIAGRRAHAFLGAHRREPWTPDADEIAFLQAVANVLAAARERADAEEAMRRQALHDQLTGLPNRTLVGDRLVQALERARHQGTTTGVCVLDLDQFKAVNDALGHSAADELLVVLARRLLEVIGPLDTAGRLSGDEFVVLCEDVGDAEEAAHMAPRLLDALSGPVTIAGEEHSVTASAGIAFDTGGELSAGELLRNAEAAKNRAKERGRGRIEVFGEDVLERTLGRLRLERDLRGALDRDELWLAFQPIVSLVDDRVVGLEALLRWRHDERGQVSPADFIPIAEESGLIGDIGAWVLREACAEAARWDTAVQVNVSPRQLDDEHLPRLVADTLRETGLPPERLTLEITEGTVMDRSSDPVEVLRALRELGAHVVLDDFGTGYSSLSRLQTLPIDGLKIDRSFVAALSDKGSPSRLVVAGVIRVCAALGVAVVAEGVETAAQREQLARLGCLLAQGFLLARPMPPEAVAQHLSRTS